MMSRKPYYPNNWKQYKDSPSEWFDAMPFEQFMDWKVANWELPSSVGCIIRETNINSGKVTEHIYRRPHAAQTKVKKMMAKGESEFVVCTPEEIHHLFPKEYFNDKDYDYEIEQ